MFVRMKTGKYAGEVREVAFEAGRDLIDSGRADKFTFEGPAELPLVVQSVADPLDAEVAKPAPRIIAPGLKRKGKR